MHKQIMDFEKYYEGKNDITQYLQPKIGKRFAIFTKSNTNNLIDLSTKPDNFIGLYDLNFLDYGDVMSNREVEKIHNIEIIKEARGDVLIAGLGIGLILLPIMNKTEVKSIEVVELQQERGILFAPIFSNFISLLFDSVDRFVLNTRGELGVFGRIIRKLFYPLLLLEQQLPVDFGYTLFVRAERLK